MSTDYATAEAVRAALAAAAKVERDRQALTARHRATIARMGAEGYRHLLVMWAAVVCAIGVPATVLALVAMDLGWVR